MARSALALLVLLCLPVVASAQADTTATGIRFRMPGSTLPALRIPAGHRLARTTLRPDTAQAADAWSAGVRRGVDSAQAARQGGALMRSLYGQTQQADAPGAPQEGVLGLGKQYVDLALDGTAGLELRSDRFRNERCTPYQLQDPSSGCQGGFKPPRIDSEFMVRAAGVLGRRLYIDVDFDNKRDFDANNDIRIFYQGLDDEIVQRIEFGTVTFTPPSSRFITAAIPAYSFGVNSRFEFGPVTLGALAASQKGSAVTERTYTVGATSSQPQDRTLRDLDFEQGRFFWVIDPALVPGYPAVDILNLTAGLVPRSVRPEEVRVYRNRAGGNANLGGIRAFAYRPDAPLQRTGILTWELLIDGQDYALDPTGFWLAFANRLDGGDYLAVSYLTADSTLVGSFPSTDNPAANDSLLLIVRPNAGADAPTFRHEMRQVYRVAGTDLTRQSLHVDLMLNRSESPAEGASTFLAALGLAIPTDPDVIDVDNRVFPRPRDPLALQVLRESYIIFPHLQPFADATKLTPAEAVDSLYKTPLYLLFTQGPPARFQFRLQYNAAGGGERNVIELNAFQIRDGSEQILVGGRILERGVDYSISYDLGQVTFLDPDALFGNSQAYVTARFEERGIFAVAPTAIYGLTSTYKVGDAGTLNFIGIYQEENTVFSRPPVGFEPSANLVGGVTGDFKFRPAWPTRLMDKLIVGHTEAPSALDISGEFAFTAPQANRAGEAYLEEFEGEAGSIVSMRENSWGFGSRPTSAAGLELVDGFGAGFDSADAVALTWQNLVPGDNGQPAQFRAQDIDSLIRVTGGSQPLETVLYTTFHPDTAGGFLSGSSNRQHWTLPRRDFRPRWRSMVTSLSATGADLSQNEFLEFWLYQLPNMSADSAGLNLVIDLGSVGEDALSIAPESLTVTGFDSTWTGRRYAGVDQLDSERQPTGYFNAATDDNGILIDRTDQLVVDGAVLQDVSTCSQVLSGTVALYPWGDLSARCTRGNSTMDTEDLNGDNVLDANGPNDNVNRYIVNLRDPKYFVRNGGTGWRLYRVPLRQPDESLGTPNMRLVQHLRITIATPSDGGVPDTTGKFALARMRFIGSPWVRRSDRPVLGLSGATAEPHGEVVISTISTENQELGYEPPPGVIQGAGRQDAVGGQQVNERSLRILGRDLRPGERAEGYFRFVAGPQNLLRYRTLRLWVRGRGDGWLDNRLQAVFKVASDERNFYAYRAPALIDTWEPEVVIELDTWRTLRADIEQRWLSGEAPSGAVECGAGDVNAYIACEGPYFVQVADPGIRPPNLAAVQEMDAAIYYAGTGAPLDEAELWVDDIRLVDPVNTVGTATALSARLAAADVADLSVAYVRQDGNFQQLGQDPTFLTTAVAQAALSVRADRFLPASLGVMLPISVSYVRSSTDPILVTGTDLRADDLEGLRRPSASQWTFGGSLRRSKRSNNWLVHSFIDPLSLNGNFVAGNGQTELSKSRTRQYALGAAYNLSLPRRGPKLPLDGIVDAMPGWMENSPLGTGMRGSILSLAPTAIRLTSGLTRNQFDFTTYSVVVARADDSLRTPTLNLSHFWRNSGSMTLQPLGMLTLSGDLSSTRDLRHYSDTTTIGRVVEGSRQEFLGMDVGVERDRQVTTGVSLAPAISTWLRPRWNRGSGFTLNRSLTSREPVRVDGDSGAYILPQTYSNSQVNELGVGLDLDQVVGMVAGDSSGVGRFLSRLRPVDFSVRRSRFSTFDLATFDPSIGYILALGGRETFLEQEGEQALGASEEEDLRVGTGAELPGGLSVTLSYADITTERFIQLGEGFTTTESRQREWPQGSARMTKVIRSGPIAMLGLGFVARRRDGTTRTPSESGASTTKTMSNLLNPDLNLGLRSGLNVNLSWSRNARSDQNSANTTEGNTDLLSASLLQSIRLPASLSAARRPLRATVTGQHTISQTCLLVASRPEEGCRPVADTRRISVLGGLTTEVAQFAEAGLNVQYVSNEVRHLNQKTSQIAITMSLRMQFSSGDIR